MRRSQPNKSLTVLLLLLGLVILAAWLASDSISAQETTINQFPQQNPRHQSELLAAAQDFEKGKWLQIGSGSATGRGISSNSGRSFHPSLAIAAGDLPVVAWDDESGGNWEIYVRRWQPAPVPGFTASPTSGLLPLTVDFTNLSTGDFTACLWDFGNGRTVATCDNPSIQFSQPGGYPSA